MNRPPQAFQCPTCSAPLEPPDARGFAHCRYCGTTVEPREVPAEQAPPRIEVVVQPFGTGAYFAQPPRAPQARTGSAFAGVVMFLIFGVAAAISATGAGRGCRSTVSKLPVTCATNEQITIDGATYDGGGTAITAGLNCHITIKNSTIRASRVLTSGYNAVIVVENSRLTGTSSGIGLGGNGHLTADANSLITSTGTAIDADDVNVEINLNGTHVHGGPKAIEGGMNLKLVMVGGAIDAATAIGATENAHIDLSDHAKVTGTKDGIAAASNLKVTVNNSTIEAPDTAIRAQYNASFNFGGATIKGGAAAYSVSSLENEASAASTVTGAKVVGGKSTDVPAPPTPGTPRPALPGHAIKPPPALPSGRVNRAGF